MAGGIKDVAAQAGVSIASVSRVLNGSKPVAPETRDRVLAAVQDMHYSIDQRARALRRKQSGTLGLIVAEVRNPFFSEVIGSIEAVAYESNFSLFLCNSDEDPERERLHLQTMRSHRIDGIIILPVTPTAHSLLPLLHHQVPVVCLDRRFDDVELDTVLVDNAAGAAMAVSHLALLGHTRIALIGGRPNTPAIERLAGYRQALAAHGIPEDPELIRQGDSMRVSGYTETKAVLGLSSPPTALFVINNPMALGAYTAIRDAGLCIPGDVSIVGFDDTPWSELLGPPLTTVAQPTDHLGTAAAQLLLQRIARRYTGPAQRITLPPSFIERASTAPAPSRQQHTGSHAPAVCTSQPMG